MNPIIEVLPKKFNVFSRWNTGLAFCFDTILPDGLSTGDKPVAVTYVPASSYPNKLYPIRSETPFLGMKCSLNYCIDEGFQVYVAGWVAYMYGGLLGFAVEYFGCVPVFRRTYYLHPQG
jgi:hypothetical protein